MAEHVIITESNQEDPAVKKIAFVIYIIYFVSFFMPILPIVGVVLAYVFENDAKGILKSHYQYLIRSFWLALLYFTIAGLSLLLIIGLILIPVAIIWWLIRLAKGLKSLMRNNPIESPKTWLF